MAVSRGAEEITNKSLTTNEFQLTLWHKLACCHLNPDGLLQFYNDMNVIVYELFAGNCYTKALVTLVLCSERICELTRQLMFSVSFQSLYLLNEDC